MSEFGTVTIEHNLMTLKERKRLLDDVWLLVFLVLLVAVGVPWYLRTLDIDFAPVAWSLFGYGLIYVLTSLAADRLRSRRSLMMLIAALQTAGILFLGFVWHLTGSLQNPMFLLAFVLPVVAGSLVVVNWQSYLTVLFSIATVLTVALIDAPELRWYVTQIGPWARWLMDLLPARSATGPQPFPSLNTPPSYLFVLLVFFTVLLFTVALMTESVTSFLLRLSGRLEAATRALGLAEDLSLDVLRASPSPAALVHSDTFKIAQASQSFMHHLFLTSESLLNKDLFGLIEFAYPEVVKELIAGTGGKVPLAVYRVHGEARVAEVRVEPITHGGHHYAYVNMQDISDLQYLQIALNSISDALIVTSENQHILYFNQAAQDLFGDLRPGMDAAIPLRQANLPNGWWELGIRTRQERRLEVRGQRYIANCVAARILGEAHALTVLTLRRLENDR